jgi:hypothetical protein
MSNIAAERACETCSDYTRAIDQLQQLVTDRFGDVATTTQATVWDDGDYDVRIFHTINTVFNVELGAEISTREQLRVSSTDASSDRVRHELIRTVTDTPGASLLYCAELPRAVSPVASDTVENCDSDSESVTESDLRRDSRTL